MAAEGTSRRRILDYLNDGEEFGVEGPSSAAATPRALAAARSLLPRFRWARLAKLGGKGRGHGKGRPPKPVGEKEIVAVEERELRDSSGASASAACAAAAGDGSGGDTTRPSDLSVGLSLVFLLAKTSDEFNKMARVRAEMETLIREFKGQQAMATTNTGGDDDVSGTLNPDSAASSCLTDGNEPQTANARSEDHRRRHRHQVASSSGAEMDAASRRRMDVLEEEFHAEIERVRASYGADTSPFSTGEERDEGGAEPSDDDDNIADCRQGFESDLGDEDDHDNNEEEEDDDDDADRYHGVSAVELERRLHELLHLRNQERIEELEAALRRAEKRLFEKEMEASLWKDTAKMVFRHDHDHDDDESP